MPIVTFWSNNEKAIGQTVSASVAATVMAIEHNYKVLLISANFNDKIMEKCFGVQETNKELIKTLIKRPQINLDSGIKGLLKLADSNRVTPENIHDYTKIIFKNRLEVLYSPMNIFDNSQKALVLEKLKNIIINASRYYDQVIVDLSKGIKYQAQMEILNMSDVIVENIDQGFGTIQEFMQLNEYKTMSNKLVWNICKYDKNSKYNSKNITRNILKKQMVCETHYNTLLSDAVQDGNIIELLIRFKTVKDDNDDNALFTKAIKELIQAILLKYQETRMKM